MMCEVKDAAIGFHFKAVVAPIVEPIAADSRDAP